MTTVGGQRRRLERVAGPRRAARRRHDCFVTRFRFRAEINNQMKHQETEEQRKHPRHDDQHGELACVSSARQTLANGTEKQLFTASRERACRNTRKGPFDRPWRCTANYGENRASKYRCKTGACRRSGRVTIGARTACPARALRSRTGAGGPCSATARR